MDAAAHPALPYNLFRLHADREGRIGDGAFYQLRDGREGKNLLVIITKSPYPEWSRWEDTTTARAVRPMRRQRPAGPGGF